LAAENFLNLPVNQRRTGQLGGESTRKNAIKSCSLREFNPAKSRTPWLLWLGQGKIMTQRNLISSRERWVFNNLSKRRLLLLMSREICRIFWFGPRCFFFINKNRKLIAPVWTSTTPKMKIELEAVAFKKI
jgi:hypothetical protein